MSEEMELARFMDDGCPNSAESIESEQPETGTGENIFVVWVSQTEITVGTI